MGGWIKTDWNFDLPMATLVIGARQFVIMKNNGEVPLHNEDDPESLAKAFTALIEARRPNLRGLTLVSMRCGGGLWWELTVLHPSLAKTPDMTTPPKQRLDSCFNCGKPIPWEGGLTGGRTFRAELRHQVVEVCSEECVKRAREREKEQEAHLETRRATDNEVYGVPAMRAAYGECLKVREMMKPLPLPIHHTDFVLTDSPGGFTEFDKAWNLLNGWLTVAEGEDAGTKIIPVEQKKEKRGYEFL